MCRDIKKDHATSNSSTLINAVLLGQTTGSIRINKTQLMLIFDRYVQAQWDKIEVSVGFVQLPEFLTLLYYITLQIHGSTACWSPTTYIYKSSSFQLPTHTIEFLYFLFVHY